MTTTPKHSYSSAWCHPLHLISLCAIILLSACVPIGLEEECLNELTSDEPLYGVCQEHPDLICLIDGELDFSKVPHHEERRERTCDGIDNDCDGSVDEGLLNLCGECGPDTELICDGQDNDCDGKIDEGLLNACGECRSLDESPDALYEICDGEDNDCDGKVDENVRNRCGSCGYHQEETCNLIDDDCDGQIDEGKTSALWNNHLIFCGESQSRPLPCDPFCPQLNIASIGDWTVRIGDPRYTDESPSHLVEINEPLYLSSTEITIGQYRDCIDYGPCTPLEDEGGLAAFQWPSWYLNHPEYRVTWQQARTYAHWVGGELPTERQWEAAWMNYKLATRPVISYRDQVTFQSLQEQVDARWNEAPEEERVELLDDLLRHEWLLSYYPDSMGGSIPQNNPLQLEGHSLWSRPVAFNDEFPMMPQYMLGNVWEWTLDEYAEDSYSAEPQAAETVHCVGTPCMDDAAHVARGGSTSDGVSALRPSNRASRFLVGRTGIRVLFKERPVQPEP